MLWFAEFPSGDHVYADIKLSCFSHFSRWNFWILILKIVCQKSIFGEIRNKLNFLLWRWFLGKVILTTFLKVSDTHVKVRQFDPIWIGYSATWSPHSTRWRILDSYSRIPDSKAQDSGFHKQRFPDSGIRITFSVIFFPLFLRNFSESFVFHVYLEQ